MENNVLIGKLKNSGDEIYLEKHNWDCEWYWAFGYLGNKDLHFHMSEMIPNVSNSKEIAFKMFNDDIDVIILDEKLDGFVIMELFKQAYTLKDYAELLHMGHAGIGNANNLGINQDKELAKQVNAKLEKVLDDIWNYITTSLSKGE